MTDPVYRPPLDMTRLPTKNWVRRYYDFHSSRNKAPYPEYWHAGAIMFLSTGIRKRMFFTLEGDRVYTGIWTLIMGPSTRSKKTMALGPLNYWLREKYTGRGLESDYGSAAGFLRGLADRPQGYLVHDECARLLARINNSAEAGTIRDFLCQMYDGVPTLTKRIAPKKNDDGIVKIDNGYPSLMLSTTPENLSANSTLLDITSGWLFRFLFYNPDSPREPVRFNFSRARKDPDEIALMTDLDAIIEKINPYHEVKCVFLSEAEESLNSWHMTRSVEMQKRGIAEPTFNRLEIAAMKMSCIYTLADPDHQVEPVSEYVVNNVPTVGQLVIPREYIEIAMAQVDGYFLPHALSVFDIVERSAGKNVQDKIITVLRSNGGQMTQRDLMRAIHVRVSEFTDHIDALIASEEITTTKTERERGGLPTIVYTLCK